MSLRTPRDDSRSTNVAAAAAALCVGVAIWLSLQPARLGDLYRIAAWTSEWLHGTHLYGADRDVDYPPWAIVTLSPLALVPFALAPVCWVFCNLTALVIVARRLAASRQTMFFLLMAAGAMRTLNQFSLISVTLAVCATTRVTPLSPLWLGLALMKPQIGGVFWALAVWQRQWRLAMLSLIVPCVLLLVYAWRAHVTTWEALAAYATSIGVQYGGVFWGRTEISSVVRAMWPQWPPVLIASVIALVVVAAVPRARAAIALPLASLLSVRHLSYDLVLLLPSLSALEGAAMWIGAALLALDPSALVGLAAPGSFAARHGDRIALIGLWLLVAAGRRHAADSEWPRDRHVKRH